MKKLLVVASTVFLSGCITAMTPKEVVDKGPLSTYTSSKNSGDVVKCIAPKWEETKDFGILPIVSARETESGHRIIFYVADDVKYVVDIDNSPSGSKTKLYVGKTSSYGGDKRIKDVSDCQ